MSSSTFHITEGDSNDDDTLTLFVRPDGTVTPDKETVKRILSSRASIDINLMTMKKVEAGEVNILLDNLTYVNSEEMEDPQEMTELSRNLYNFRMDHDYTPFTSPSHVPASLDMVDELAQTLSMLEDGSLDPQLTNEPLTKITKIVKGKKQTIFVNSKEKQRMINAGLLKERPTEKVFKKPKPIQTRTMTRSQANTADSGEEEEEMEAIGRVNEQDENVGDEEVQLKRATTPAPPTPSQSQPVAGAAAAVLKKAVVVEKISAADIEASTKTAAAAVTTLSGGDDKKPPIAPTTTKKEKKVLKPVAPIPDDMALFSTPDIIRRVGKEFSTSPKPAKISPDHRSKSNADKPKRLSTDEAKTQRRMSLDSRKDTAVAVAEDLPKTPTKTVDQVSVQDFSDTLSNSSIVDEEQLEPLPSAEDIRAMIHNENTKSFTINSVLPDADGVVAAAGISLDAASLELDQSILDNINTDLISEDILYQVAQSLVDNNTELQNVIDKSLTDGHLALDSTALQPGNHDHDADAIIGNETLSPAVLTTATTAPEPIVPNTQSRQQQETVVTTNAPDARSGATQIVRPDGRIVVIPPIERPTTRSRNKKTVAPVNIATPQPKPTIKPPLDDEHVPGVELDASDVEEEAEENEDEEESDDDPNKLWCICNQPHNNRFMICCDTCEEWYHGKCVNVTKAMGHLMEQQGKEWMCVYCKDPNLKRPKAALRRMRKASRTSSEGGGKSPLKSKYTTPTQPSAATIKMPADKMEKKANGGCVVCGKASRSSSIYCSDPCILKHAQGVEKVVVYNRSTGHLLSGSNAPSAANLDKWLLDNPSYEVVRSSNKGVAKASKPVQLTQAKLKMVKNVSNVSPGVSLAIQKKGVNVGVLQHSPKTAPAAQSKPIILNSSLKTKALVGSVSGLKVVSKQAALSQAQSQSKMKLVSPLSSTKQHQHAVTATSSPKPTKVLTQTKLQPTVTKKESTVPMPQKTPKARQAEFSHQPKQENLRETVKKTFFEQLSNRLKNVDDLQLSDDELREVSDEIESQLYKCFADTGQKYKNKYRSLIFNIKDPKNQTLWRRICEKNVNPYQLVRLSHDDLASQELALWRERETKHQLDMIKKSELELLNCSRQYVFKTHKGETVFEDDHGKDQVKDVIACAVTDSIGEDAAGDVDGDEDGNSHDSKSGTTTTKHNRRDHERSKDRKKDAKRRSRSKDRSKKRSHSRDRSSRHSERRRSRSRDRHRRSSHKSSRHKKEDDAGSRKDKIIINTERLDKKSKEILEQLVDKQIVPPLEDTVWKQEEVVQITAPPPPVVTESDSDHEPSSTVTIPTPPRVDSDDLQSAKKAPVTPEAADASIEETMDSGDGNDRRIPEVPKQQESLWKGAINMIDVANIAICAYEVSGDSAGLGDELPKSLDIVGRISPTTVWDYIGKMKTSNSKTISVLRLTAASWDERTAYLSLYSYLSSRQRLGVVKCVNKRVKDFYILPLAAHSPIPEAILPITGPGFEDGRPSLLVGVIVRDKRKRTHEAGTGGGTGGTHHQSKRIRVEVVSSNKAAPSSTPPPSSISRSYTPPPTRDPRLKLPVPNLDLPEDNDEDMDEPYSPADSDPDSMPEPKSQLNASDLSSLLSAGVKASSFLETGITQPSSTATFEPFSNKFDGIPGLDVTPASLPSSSLELEQKMAELDQKIAAQKAEIDKVSKDLVSSGGSSDLESATLANIALPSNLQQILESIKSIANKTDTPEYQPETASMSGSVGDLTIPLMLPKLSARSVPSGSPNAMDAAAAAAACSIPLNFPPNQKHQKTTDVERPTGSVLSSLSEEDLIKKAAEMLGETESPPPKLTISPSPPPAPTVFLGRLELNQPPIPGLDD